jgi:hypothetical protein
MNSWQRFSTILKAVSSLSQLFPLMCRYFFIWFNSICKFYSYFLSYWSLNQKTIASAYIMKCVPSFSSSSFSFKSYIKVFELLWIAFCTGWEIGASFSLQHVNIQFSHHHLLKRLSFLKGTFLAPLSGISLL